MVMDLLQIYHAPEGISLAAVCINARPRAHDGIAAAENLIKNKYIIRFLIKIVAVKQ